jgi:hypothetical protein
VGIINVSGGSARGADTPMGLSLVNQVGVGNGEAV